MSAPNVRQNQISNSKVKSRPSQHLRGKVCRPPPATAVNYNLVESVVVKPGERLFWLIIHSPDGSFTYDYRIQRRRSHRCFTVSCPNLVDAGQRKCAECQTKARKDRNRRYYERSKQRN